MFFCEFLRFKTFKRRIKHAFCNQYFPPRLQSRSKLNARHNFKDFASNFQFQGILKKSKLFCEEKRSRSVQADSDAVFNSSDGQELLNHSRGLRRKRRGRQIGRTSDGNLRKCKLKNWRNFEMIWRSFLFPGIICITEKAIVIFFKNFFRETFAENLLSSDLITDTSSFLVAVIKHPTIPGNSIIKVNTILLMSAMLPPIIRRLKSLQLTLMENLPKNFEANLANCFESFMLQIPESFCVSIAGDFIVNLETNRDIVISGRQNHLAARQLPVWRFDGAGRWRNSRSELHDDPW